MQVYVATEQRLLRYNGAFYVEAIGGQEFWQRYLDVFSEVKVVARVTDIESCPGGAVRVDGKSIRVKPVPSYTSLLTGALRVPQISSHLRPISNDSAAFILRVPGVIGTLLSRQLQKRGWPFALEVVGDPHESLSFVALNSYSGYVVRPLLVAALKGQCRNAVAVSYVTQKVLQNKYPTNGYAVGCSDVILTEDWFTVSNKWPILPLQKKVDNPVYNLIFVGSLSQRYKGLHILLHALHLCHKKGLPLCLNVLGDGQHRQEYEKLAAVLGLDEAVVFHGYVKHGSEVLQHMQDADLFVMPSLVEGLPRAMIEAMACGLPCIGSKVGGIPELLPAKDMFEPDNVNALADKIREVTQTTDRMKEMAERNYQTALQYRAETLHVKRNAFYQFVHDATMDRIGVN
jgi:phosphatidyl-myo-inositol dimannoside synthase